MNIGSEIEFGFDELFFSRTNKKGIIESGNSIFQRVSEFEWDDILGKPHRVVRHPDMPRGAFHYLWEMILSGQMIGAYVVNRTKNDSYYWVYALVTPIENGFLSVRLKPSSPNLFIIKEKYSQLLSLEKEKQLSPKESQKQLLSIITDLGFKDYRHFMVESLMKELEYRQIQLNAAPITILCHLEEALKTGELLQKKSEEISFHYKKTAMIPLNLQVQAARIGEEAAPIATISSQYDRLAQEIQEEIGKFVVAGKTVQEKIQDCQFSICNSLLQKEMYDLFEKETKQTPVDKVQEMKLLQELSQKQLEKARQNIHETQKVFVEFKEVHANVRNLSIGLEMISISGKMEAAKLSVTSRELHGLLKELSVFKDYLKQTLKEIDELGVSMFVLNEKMKRLINE